MTEHRAFISWRQAGGDFLRGRFSREHTWRFDGGATVTATAAPAVVPPPLSNPAGVDPEEALVAAASSCHMLTFLWLASRQGFVIDSYDDEATGTMARNEKGIPWISAITLRPRIAYGGARRPTAEEEARLHEQAHEQCFITQSIKAEITVAAPPA